MSSGHGWGKCRSGKGVAAEGASGHALDRTLLGRRRTSAGLSRKWSAVMGSGKARGRGFFWFAMDAGSWHFFFVKLIF